MNLSKKEIEDILSDWNLGKLKKFKKAEKGVVNHNWLITTTKGKYVLRGLVFFRKRKDVNFELKYSNYLKNKKFPYKIPAPIPTKNKKLFIKIGKNYFWVYKFIEGRIIKKFNKSHLKEVAKMMALYHKIIENSKLKNRRGKGYAFTKEILLEEINKFLKMIKNKAKIDKKDKIFLKESSILIPLLKSLDGKEFNKLKKYPLHRDINPENTVWKNGKLIGIIDFETVSEINSTIMKDIVVMIQYSCREDRSKIDLNLFKFFLKEYKKNHSLTDKEIKFVPDLITSGAIDDFQYQYWLFVYDPTRAKLYRLKTYSKMAKWAHKNKEKILKAIL